MNCREAKNLITAGVYGRLTPEERAELENHSADCRACARLYEKSSPLLGLRAGAGEEEVPLPDWDKSWSRISAGAIDIRPPRAALFARPAFGRTGWTRGAIAAAALLLVFAIGYFAGRRHLDDRSADAAAAVTADAAARGSISPAFPFAASAQVLLAEYADSLGPVLVNFLNRGDVRPPDGLREIERRVVRNMLEQTRLLRSLSAESGGADGRLGDLLQDLEFILTSMANLDPEDKESADHLGRIIREKEISPRLRDFAAFSII